ncbi:hypothetical protein [Haloarcula sp. CBA1127]|uniref:hypothetical protein n=1 Tax=Haloarcula sp. CBA1127 TaxID=1765055 RepID=UPI00073F55E8|nr:hypothetical protein [Haloarcula sp. CBA1127]
MQRDELRADKGSGRLSAAAERELRELDDPTHPRQTLGPETELELVGERVELAADDERKWCSDRRHTAADKAEPSCDGYGRPVDLQRDTPNVGVSLGPTSRDFLDAGLPEMGDLTTGIDDAASTDLSLDELTDDLGDMNDLEPL